MEKRIANSSLLINDINISFGKRNIIHHSSISFASGQVTGIYGESGIGKTSLLNYIYDWLMNNNHQVFYITQFTNLLDDMNCYDNIIFLSKLYNIQLSKKDVDQAASFFDLKLNLNLYPQSLSGGERQLVTLLSVFLICPKYILLDEITASVDEERKGKIIKLIEFLSHELGCSVIMSTHDSALTSIMNSIYKIDELTLKQMKSSEVSKPHRSIKDNKNGNNKFVLYLKGKEKKQSLYKHIFSMLLGMLVSCLVVCYLFSNQMVNETEKVLSYIPNNQVLVTHQTPPLYGYIQSKILFNEDEVELVNHTGKAYPFFGWNVTKEKGEGDHFTKINIKNGNERELNFYDKKGPYFIAMVFPFYEEQKYEALVLHELPQDGEEAIPCYITEGLANDLQIDINQSCTFETLVDVFTGEVEKSTSIVSYGDNPEEFETECINPQVQPQKMTFSVLGIVPNQTGNYNTLDEIYIPYTSMVSLLLDNEDSVFLMNGQVAVSNAYMMFSDHLKEIESELVGKLSDVGFSNSRDNHREILSMFQESYKSNVLLVVEITSIMTIIGMVILSFILEKTYKNERKVFRYKGCVKKDIRQFILADTFRDALNIMLYSILSFPVLINLFIKLGYLLPLSLPHYLMGAVCLLLFSLIAAFLSHSYSIIKT